MKLGADYNPPTEMKVTIINKSDFTGGAAMVSMRLLEALRNAGIDARMLVTEKLTDSPYVSIASSSKKIKSAFLLERLKIFASLGFKRKNLFKVDTASHGLPLWKHPWVVNADVICLNWINQGMLSLPGIEKISRLGKPIIWTMHDMWCLTGICHHADTCTHFTQECGNCFLLGNKTNAKDLSHRVWKHKADLNKIVPIHYVAVSNWLRQKAIESSLLKDAAISVIPNAFPLDSEIKDHHHRNNDKITIVMGAARLDDPIKGLPILIKATEIIASSGKNFELVTYGNIKSPQAFDNIAIPHRHLGLLTTQEALRNTYYNADIVVSASLYETLPGTLVEGQAYGCIPVSFNRGGQTDIIEHLKSGYIAEFSTDIYTAANNLAMGILWASDKQTTEMRQQMRQSVYANFSSQAIAKRYIDLFNTLL